MELSIARHYGAAVGISSLIITTAIMYALGARGFVMLASGLLAILSLRGIAFGIATALVPPRLVPSPWGMTMLRDYEPKDP
jgi:hypothetical protein